MPIGEIDKKVKVFRQQLNDELLKIIHNEKEIELSREKQLQSVQDQEERTRLIKKFGIERAQASVNIVNFNK